MGTFGFIAEFKNKIHLSLIDGKDFLNVHSAWVKYFISQPYVSRMQGKDIYQFSLDDDFAPSPLSDVNGIWCWWISAWGKSLLVNYMEIIDWSDNSLPFTYTFIVIFDGGTYISQHKDVDFLSSYKLWLQYFSRSLYVNKNQSELLSVYSSNINEDKLTEECKIKSISIDMQGEPFKLYIAKTKLSCPEIDLPIIEQ